MASPADSKLCLDGVWPLRDGIAVMNELPTHIRDSPAPEGVYRVHLGSQALSDQVLPTLRRHGLRAVAHMVEILSPEQTKSISRGEVDARGSKHGLPIHLPGRKDLLVANDDRILPIDDAGRVTTAEQATGVRVLPENHLLHRELLPTTSPYATDMPAMPGQIELLPDEIAIGLPAALIAARHTDLTDIPPTHDAVRTTPTGPADLIRQLDQLTPGQRAIINLQRTENTQPETFHAVRDPDGLGLLTFVNGKPETANLPRKTFHLELILPPTPTEQSHLTAPLVPESARRHAAQRSFAHSWLEAASAAGRPEVELPAGFDPLGGSGWGERGRLAKIGKLELEDTFPDLIAAEVIKHRPRMSSNAALQDEIDQEIRRGIRDRYEELGANEFGRRLTTRVGLHLWVTLNGKESRMTVWWKLDGRPADGKPRLIPAGEVKDSPAGAITGTSIDPGLHVSRQTAETTSKALGATLPVSGVRTMQGIGPVGWMQAGAELSGGRETQTSNSFTQGYTVHPRSLPLGGTMLHFSVSGRFVFDYLPEGSDTRENHTGVVGDGVLSFPAELVDASGPRTATDFHVSLPADSTDGQRRWMKRIMGDAAPASIAGLPTLAEEVVARLSVTESKVRNRVEDWIANESGMLQKYLGIVGAGDLSPEFEDGGRKFRVVVSGQPLGARRMREREREQPGVLKNDFRRHEQQSFGEGPGSSAGVTPYLRPNLSGALPGALKKIGLDVKANLSGSVSGGDAQSVTSAEGFTTWWITTETGPMAVYKVAVALKADITTDAGPALAPATATGNMIVHVPLADADRFEQMLRSITEATAPARLAELAELDRQPQSTDPQGTDIRYLPDEIENGVSLGNGVVTALPGLEEVIPEMLRLVRESGTRRTDLELLKLWEDLKFLYDYHGLLTNQDRLFPHPGRDGTGVRDAAADGDSAGFSYGLPFTHKWENEDGTVETFHFLLFLRKGTAPPGAPRRLSSHGPPRQAFMVNFSGPTWEKWMIDRRQWDRGFDISGRATFDVSKLPALGAGRGPGKFGLLNVGVQGGHEQSWPGAQERQAGQSSMVVEAVSYDGTVYPFGVNVEAVIQVSREGSPSPRGVADLEAGRRPGSPLDSVHPARVRVIVPEPFTLREPSAPDEAATIGRISVVDTGASNDLGSGSPAWSGSEQRRVPDGVTSLAPGDRIPFAPGGPALAGVLRRTPPTGMSPAARERLALRMNPHWLARLLTGGAAFEQGGVRLTFTLRRMRPTALKGIPGRAWGVWERTVRSGSVAANGHTSASEVPQFRSIPMPAIEVGTRPKEKGEQTVGLLPLPKSIVGHKSGHRGRVRSEVKSTGRWEEHQATYDQWLVDVEWTIAVDGGTPVRISVTDVTVLRRSSPEVSAPPPWVPRSLHSSRIPVLSSTRSLEPLPGANQPDQSNPVRTMVESLLARNNLAGLISGRNWLRRDSASELKELSELTDLNVLRTMMPAMLGGGVILLAGNVMITLLADRSGRYGHANAESGGTIIRFGATTVTIEQSTTDLDVHGWHTNPYLMQGFPHETATSARAHPAFRRKRTASTTKGAGLDEMERTFLEFHFPNSHEYVGEVRIVGTLGMATGAVTALPRLLRGTGGLVLPNPSRVTENLGDVTLREGVGAPEDVLPAPEQSISAAPPPEVTLMRRFDPSNRHFSLPDADWFDVSVSDIRYGRVIVLDFDPAVVRAFSAEIHEVLRASAVGRFISDGIPAADLSQLFEQLAARTVVQDAVGTGHSVETGRSEGLLKGKDGEIKIWYQFFDAEPGNFWDVTNRTEKGAKPRISSARKVQQENRVKEDTIFSFATSSLLDRATGRAARDAVPVDIPNASLSGKSSEESAVATSWLDATYRERRVPHLWTTASMVVRIRFSFAGAVLDESFRLDNAVELLVEPETALARAPYFSPAGRAVETVFEKGIETPAGRWFPSEGDAGETYQAVHAQQMFPSALVVTGRYDPSTDLFSGQDVAGLSSRLGPLVGDSGLVVLPVGGVGDIPAFHPVGDADRRYQRSFAARLAAQLGIRVIAPAHLDDVLQTPDTPELRPNPPGQLVAVRFSPVDKGVPPLDVAALGNFVEHSANGEFRPLVHDLTPAVGGQGRPILGARPPLGGFGWSARRPSPTDQESKMVAQWATGQVVIGGQRSTPSLELAASMLPGVVQVYVQSGTPGEVVFAALGLVADQVETNHVLRVLTVDGNGATVRPDYDLGYHSRTGEFTADSLLQRLADRYLIDVEVEVDNGHAELKRLRPRPGLPPAQREVGVRESSPGPVTDRVPDMAATLPTVRVESDPASEPQWLHTALDRHLKRPANNARNLVTNAETTDQVPNTLITAASKAPDLWFYFHEAERGVGLSTRDRSAIHQRLELFAQAGIRPLVFTPGLPTPELQSVLDTYGATLFSWLRGGLENAWKSTARDRTGAAITFPRITPELLTLGREASGAAPKVSRVSESFGSLVWDSAGLWDQHRKIAAAAAAAAGDQTIVAAGAASSERHTPKTSSIYHTRENLLAAAAMAKRMQDSAEAHLVGPLLQLGPVSDIVPRFVEAPKEDRPSMLLEELRDLELSGHRVDETEENITVLASLVEATGKGIDDQAALKEIQFTTRILNTLDAISRGQWNNAENYHDLTDAKQKIKWVKAISARRDTITDPGQLLQLQSLISMVLECRPATAHEHVDAHPG